jgi:hypothetical protein
MKEEEKQRLKGYFNDGDPDDIFILEEEIASGSFGAVYKVPFSYSIFDI